MSSPLPRSPRPSSPNEIAIKAAEELELEDDTFEDVSDTLNQPSTEGDQTTLLKPSPNTSPVKTPSKVKAAAAQWEVSHSNASPSSAKASSPVSSFRSIPPSSSGNVSLSRGTSPVKMISQQPSQLDASSSSPVAVSPSDSTTRPSMDSISGPSRDSFAEVTLEDDNEGVEKTYPSSTSSSRIHSSSLPPPANISDSLPEPVTTPPAKDPPQTKSSFFSSALGIGLPSITSNTLSVEPTAMSTHPSRSASSSSASGSGWRSTMSNLLGNRTLSPTPPISSTATLVNPPTLSTPSADSSRNPSTSFILQHMASPTASRDRRISREMGATEKLKEGFERVRLEMEGAARDMRREEGSRENSDSPGGPNSAVDWAFWGAVVQDYEEVARTRPKELSKAIQQGIPPVIRGAIWQLMSSSKSAPLEETYKALLKLSSPHEKAIVKDLSRTFPNHQFFQQGGGLGQESLFMVVKAYSLYDQEVGYTQGLGFIVAALLLNMPDEEAFCVLVRLMDSYNLRSHFLPDMPGLQLRLFQFDRLVEDILPLTYSHFLKKGIKSSMFASQWFMTLFSYRFPLSLVYRVLDIVFAEGVEAIFRFSLALLQKSEDKLVELGFEQILSFLQTDLFEIYRAGESGDEEEEWRANDFVRDAYEVRITPFMLDSYESEYEDLCREQNKHAVELDQLRSANRNLSSQVKQLEASLATMNEEHVELVRQLVMNKIEKEETENELVRYKMLYAELAHAQQDALSAHSRFSAGSMSHQNG